MKKILSAFLLIASYSVNAENSYIEIGTTNVGSWNSIPSVTWDYGITFPDIVDNSNRSRKFVSFHKELNNDFYLLGSYTKTKTIGSETEYEINSCPFPPYCFPITYVVPGFNLRETVSTLGLGFEYSLSNYDLYAELSSYKYTKSDKLLPYGLLLAHSELISIDSALKRNGSMYRLGLIKKLSPDVDIDVSYGAYQNITLDNAKHSNKSIKLIKDFDEKFSLIFNYEQDNITGYIPLKHTNLSLSLRTKF